MLELLVLVGYITFFLTSIGLFDDDSFGVVLLPLIPRSALSRSARELFGLTSVNTPLFIEVLLLAGLLLALFDWLALLYLYIPVLLLDLDVVL